jgi:acyl-[acyl carrier protein]--UDP-N-acetylglucosamine O-acyltransferase
VSATIDGLGSALSTALVGIRRQTARFDEAATRIAAGEGNLLDHFVEMKSAEVAVRCNVAVARTALDMQRNVLDILV